MLKLIGTVFITLITAQAVSAQTSSHTVVLWTCSLSNTAKIIVETSTVGNSQKLDTNATSVIRMVGNDIVERALGRYWSDTVDLNTAAAVFQGKQMIFYVRNWADSTTFLGAVQFSPRDPQLNVECNPNR